MALLSKYSVDCIATALAVFLILFIIKKRRKVPEKLNRMLPFCFAFAVYCVAAAVGRIAMETVVSKSFAAGGLATLLYAFSGGYETTDEESIINLLKSVLVNVVGEDTADELADQIMKKLELLKEDDEGLKIVKVSDLIKSYLKDETDTEKIQLASAVFVQTFDRIKSKAPGQISKKTKN